MARALVVCCSHTGATRRAAQDIASLIGADVEELVELSPHATTACGCPMKSNTAAPADLTSYDFVIAGASPSNPCATECVRAFLAAHADTVGKVAFFFTQAGSESADPILEEWTRACKKAPIASLLLPQAEIESGHVSVDLYRFANEARKKAESAKAK